MHSERKNPKQQLDQKRKDCRYVEKRLVVANKQLEHLEEFIDDAFSRYETHDIDTRRLQKLKNVLPKMRGVITRELEILLPE